MTWVLSGFFATLAAIFFILFLIRVKHNKSKRTAETITLLEQTSAKAARSLEEIAKEMSVLDRRSPSYQSDYDQLETEKRHWQDNADRSQTELKLAQEELTRIPKVVWKLTIAGAVCALLCFLFFLIFGAMKLQLSLASTSIPWLAIFIGLAVIVLAVLVVKGFTWWRKRRAIATPSQTAQTKTYEPAKKDEAKTSSPSGWQRLGGYLLWVVISIAIVVAAAKWVPRLTDTDGGRLDLLLIILLTLAVIKSKLARVLVAIGVGTLIMVVMLVGADKLRQASLTPEQRNQLQYPNYKKDWCGESEDRDYQKSNVREITINFQPGCFHGRIILPERWHSWKVEQSCGPGDWYDIWPENVDQPYPVHPCTRSIEPDFDTYPGWGPAFIFRYQGHGKTRFYATSVKWGN